MKNLKYLSLFCLVSCMVSCTDSFLDVKNPGQQTGEDYFKDPDLANQAVMACYEATHKDQDIYVFGDLMSDDALKGGSSMSDWDDRQWVREFTSNSGNSVVGGKWSNNYQCIIRCNEVISAVPKATYSEEIKQVLLGQAYFLRAYSYSKLVPLFGAVPLIVDVYSLEDLPSTRSSELEVYQQIYEDLDFAIEYLPLKSKYASDDLGRATKGAAMALKAKALMQETSYSYNAVLSGEVSGYNVDVNKNWKSVYDLTKEIIKSQEYSLTPNFAEIFEMTGENNEESVFEIQCATTQNQWGESIGNFIVVALYNRQEFGWGFDIATDELYNLFDPNDPRRWCTFYGNDEDGQKVVYGQEKEWTGNNNIGWMLSDSKTSQFITALRQNRKYASDPLVRHSNHNNQPNNVRIIRYAEVLLMNAEASYHLGLEEEARNRVNEIRERAGNSTLPLGSRLGQTSGYTYDKMSGAKVDPVKSSGTELYTDIMKERRMELALEGIRYFDLIRTGQIEKLPYPEGYTAHGGLLPIPISDVNTFGLEQNKAYN